MNTLIIGSVWPEPASSGAGVRLLEWIKLFRGQGWPVTFASTAPAGEHSADLQSMSISCCEIALNCSSFDRFIAELHPDLVLFDRFTMEEQFGWRVAEQCPQAMRVLETIDLHCLRKAREQLFKQQRQVIAEVSNQALFNDTAIREIAAILRCDLSVIISDAEMALLRKRFAINKSLLHYCSFMLTTEQIEPGPDFEQRRDFVCIGNFRHPPNMDAVRWLKSEIWPGIRKNLPNTQLHIYGAYAPPAATAMHAPSSGFLVHGRAKDVVTVMQHARINLAPLRTGAGIKTKLADAMRCGTPSITTSVGAEGMHGTTAWPGRIADDSAGLIDAAVALYHNAEAWQQASSNGLATVEQRFNAELNGKALLARILQIRENLADHRLENFAGAMLCHHQHRSSEYMSRWIEAKQALAQCRSTLETGCDH